MMARQPPPVAPRNALQSWKQATLDANSTSIGNLESSDSGSCEGGNKMTPEESVPRRNHNPLQFVKAQSPLYKKTDQQIKLTKEEVKVTKEAFKENEEEWQSKLDDWKSRRRKSSEKFLERAEIMRQIEAKEQPRQEQQRKIKKFSEIMGKKSSRSYNLSLYIDEKDDDGYGATPKPDDTSDYENSVLPSNISEGKMSEAGSIQKQKKIDEKEPPKVPQKPYSKMKRNACNKTNSNKLNSTKDLDNCSSSEPSDVECSEKDHHAINSSEEDTEMTGNTDSGIESLCENRQGDFIDNPSNCLEKSQLDLTSIELEEQRKPIQEETTDIQVSNGCNQSLKNCLKHEENKELGFNLNGAKDEGSSVYIENVIKEYVNTEIKTTESRKGKSFAEKLAIFTAGVNAPTMFESAEGKKADLAETNKESLVLRRRSAFENRKYENTVLEKRHSVDFGFGQNVTHEQNFNKKGPPPPVPVKPKIKSKAANFDSNKSVLNSNETNKNILSFSESRTSICENPSSTFQSQILTINSKLHETNIDLSIDESTDIKKINSADSNCFEQSSLEFEISGKTNYSSSNENQVCLRKDVIIPNYSDFDQKKNQVGNKTTDQDFVSFEANGLERKKDNSNENVLDTIKEAQTFFYNIKNTVSSVHELCKDSYEQESDIRICKEETCTEGKELMDEICAMFVNDQTVTDYQTDDINLESSSGNEINSVSSACHSVCDSENINTSQVTECYDIQESEITESKVGTRTNSSPLCLSLEKIDEDDVISASTTTSSDTPDTETVIETLPSNLSPLPNDESNGEDSSKLPNFQDEESELVLETNELSSTETNDENEVTRNHNDKDLDAAEVVEIPDDLLKHYVEPATVDAENDGIRKTYFSQDDDEYVCELDESLDQITSLDIIDRIEQSLMDQLQKENSHEDISQNLNCDLESVADNPWLYYSEGLRAPPDHPPPPPPLEVEKKLSCLDSKHSIKKELWRRRSDFLGLDLPETVDIYDIPPPPSGLEEFLKLEKEQTQLLEKRLSLADHENSYSANSACLDSGKYNDYFAEENTESTKTLEQWKPQEVEESFFEASYKSQYESSPETPTNLIEENSEHKARQNIHNLGAAPKAKIMDSTEWITEKTVPKHKKVIERQTSCDPNYWLAHDEEWQQNAQLVSSHSDRRYSMPPIYSNTLPDISARTWDREYGYQLTRPRSAIYYKSGYGGNTYDEYDNIGKKEIMHTQSLDADIDMNYETGTLESEVHKCSCCGKGLCEGSAMGIEALRLYFHIECFCCCLCNMQLGNGSCGTDVQVKDNQLYCPSCFSVD